MEATPPVPGWPSTRAIRGGLPNRLQFRYRGPAACGRVCPSTRARTSQWCLAEVLRCHGVTETTRSFSTPKKLLIWDDMGNKIPMDTRCKLNQFFSDPNLKHPRWSSVSTSLELEELPTECWVWKMKSWFNILLSCRCVKSSIPCWSVFECFKNCDRSWLLKETSIF